jgi:hypothetical protein
MQKLSVPGYYLKQAAARHREISAKNEIDKKAQELLSITVGWAPPTVYFRKWWAVPTHHKWMPLNMVLCWDQG